MKPSGGQSIKNNDEKPVAIETENSYESNKAYFTENNTQK